MLRVLKHITAMDTYQPPWTGLDRTGYLRMDLNENTRLPPAPVRAALAAYAAEGRLEMYPRYEQFLPVLAKYVGVDPSRLIVTNGSDQALEVVMRTFLAPGDRLLVAQPEFPMVGHIASVIGAKIVGVPFDAALEFPEAGFHAAAAGGCELIVLITPNNPTGTDVALDTIREILRRNSGTPVLVDEAYFEYTGSTSLQFLEEHPNLLITRTFSKAFAMAGLRLGYIIGAPELIGQFRKVRGPFDVNSCALVAAAAQIDAPEHWQPQIAEVMKTSKPLLLDFLSSRRVRHRASPAHFLLVWPPSVTGAVNNLKDQGILVRPMKAAAIRDTFRMSVGTPDETRRFIHAYEQYLRETNQ